MGHACIHVLEAFMSLACLAHATHNIDVLKRYRPFSSMEWGSMSDFVNVPEEDIQSSIFKNSDILSTSIHTYLNRNTIQTVHISKKTSSS